MKKIYQPSVLPIYAIALVWLVFGLVAPLNSVGRFTLCAVLSAAAFLLGKLFFPGKMIEVEAKPDTGDAQADDMITRGRAAAAQIRQTDAKVLDDAVRQKLEQIAAVTDQILAHLEKEPGKAAQLQTFLDYYLPTTQKLLDTYVELQDQSVKGENIQNTMTRISAMFETILAAFSRQLDALFESVSVDVTADIQVMEQMMAANGLTKQKDF